MDCNELAVWADAICAPPATEPATSRASPHRNHRARPTAPEAFVVLRADGGRDDAAVADDTDDERRRREPTREGTEVRTPTPTTVAS